MPQPPPHRDPTPDPFEVDHSPADDGPGYDLYSPASSGMSSQANMHAVSMFGASGTGSRLPLSQRMPSETTLSRSGAPVSRLEPPLESDEEDAEASQLFPGSDLF